MVSKKTTVGFSRRERQIMDIVYRRREASVNEVLVDLEDAPSYSVVRSFLRSILDGGRSREVLTSNFAIVSILVIGAMVLPLAAMQPVNKAADVRPEIPNDNVIEEEPINHQQQVAGEAIDLLKRYPTELTERDYNAQNARPWEFTRDDIYLITEFSFVVGEDLRVEIKEADLGIGHSKDGAVWAVVIPRKEGIIHSTAFKESETIDHVWLRFHPAELGDLFPTESVISIGDETRYARILQIANKKIYGSYQTEGRATIPGRKNFTVDADTAKMMRRFFMVDREKGTANYESYFEVRTVPEDKPFTSEVAASSFDLLWQGYDRNYAMFVIRPEVDWEALRDQYRPKALECTSAFEFAEVCAEMLKPLRDLHIWVSVDGQSVPVFNRPRESNANQLAYRPLIGNLNSAGGYINWGKTQDKTGYILIKSWQGDDLVDRFDEVLERMRDTRGLIVDVRLNGGGSETLAQKVAGRFANKAYIYSYSQFRDGPSHSDLTEKYPRKFDPRGPWRYDRPVTVLIGQKCMSSNESFIAMMAECPQVTTMGDHTCGSSGNPMFVELPGQIRVSLPQWIDLLPDGGPLDERGVRPDIYFEAEVDSFSGNRDDLLKTAVEGLSQKELPVEPIAGRSIFAIRGELETDDPKVVSVWPVEGAKDVSTATVIRLKFDRPMNPLRIGLNWDDGTGLDYKGFKYNEQDQEFLITVELEKGTTYFLSTREFFDRQGNSAQGFQWSFSTQAQAVGEDAPKPKVVRVSPGSDEKLSMLTEFGVTFNEPMDPKFIPVLEFPIMDFSDEGELFSRHVDYDPVNYKFTVPMFFPPNWEGTITLKGFRSEKGGKAEPLKLDISTGEEAFSSGISAKLARAQQSSELKKILENIWQARAQITSLEETVLRVEKDKTSLSTNYAVFKFQGENQFYADVSQTKTIPYFIGSDGENCWQYKELRDLRKIFIQLPFDQMHQKSLTISDPFMSTSMDIQTAMEKYRLEYMGEGELEGRKCYLIRGWRLDLIIDSSFSTASVEVWWIDSETYQVRQIESDKGTTQYFVYFSYSKINQRFSDEEFQPVFVTGINPQDPEPLGEKYDTRYLNVIDGSSGSFAVQWGRKGKGSTNSGIFIR